MAVTLQTLLNDVEKAVGGQLDYRDDELSVVNEAGRYFYAMHRWRWRMRPTLDLDFVANQNYVELPASCGNNCEIIDLDMDDSLGFKTEKVSLSELQNIRAQSYTSTSSYFWAVSYPQQNDRNTPPGPARIEIHPTPTTSQAGAIKATVRAGWVDLYELDDVAAVPEGYDFILRKIVRAFAKDYLMDETKELESILISPVLSALKRSDAAANPNLGMTRGGILQSDPRRDYAWNFTTENPGD